MFLDDSQYAEKICGKINQFRRKDELLKRTAETY